MLSDFDPQLHEQLKESLRTGALSLARNRLPFDTPIEDVGPGDLSHSDAEANSECRAIGRLALKRGEVGVLTLAGGVGSRWSHGAGNVKALYAFHALGGHDRSFIEVHLAKTRAVAQACGTPLPHIIATSFLTHEPLDRHLARHNLFGYEGPVVLSRGCSVGWRLVPPVRELLYAWSQGMAAPPDAATRAYRQQMVAWARQSGGASDYSENTPLQCLYPLGHWYEFANLLRNGTLPMLLAVRPQLRYLMLHNIDTLGADVDVSLLGWHVRQGADLTYELIRREPGDRGGGLARVDGRVRLVEGLALPERFREDHLAYYNTMTTWIAIDSLLERFGLARTDLIDLPRVDACVQRMADRVPTYVTLKDVRNHDARGCDTIYPVAQCEKLWGDMSGLTDVVCRYLVVPRQRGQQLKELSQLADWRENGSARHVEQLCAWRSS